jgi:DNA polymerase
MRTVVIEPNFDAWRERARELLAQRVRPDEVLWTDDTQEVALFAAEGIQEAVVMGELPKVPAAFVEMALRAAAHTDERRWGVLYRVLWRLTYGGERHLLAMATDADVRLIQAWCKAVSRDIHKMHAFVRFRLVSQDETSGREQFVAWFEPEHHIMRLGTPFFQKRFASMDWSILTPHECAHWDGKTLRFTPGVSRDEAPNGDALDELWRTYYRSIFNPARLKVTAMQSEMPKKYWKNLPEASLIAELIADSQGRVKEMLDTEARPVKAAPKNAYLDSLRAMNQQEPRSDA